VGRPALHIRVKWFVSDVDVPNTTEGIVWMHGRRQSQLPCSPLEAALGGYAQLMASFMPMVIADPGSSFPETAAIQYYSV
jgi:hypothetical protein